MDIVVRLKGKRIKSTQYHPVSSELATITSFTYCQSRSKICSSKALQKHKFSIQVSLCIQLRVKLD